MRSHSTCRPNRASKLRSHYIFFGWGPIEATMICLNAAVGICAEWHSNERYKKEREVRTGSNFVHVHATCRSTVVASPASTTAYQSVTAGKRQVASFDGGRWGNVKFLAKMPTVTAIHLRRPKAVLYPRWALGVRTKLGQSSLYDR